ncbi:MAG: hypothetical protein IJ542_02725 [Clostridia bacterium]|nr:hypothetical protein [Clostridia bacterium]
MRSRLAKIIDITISTTAVSIVCFAWIRRYIKNLPLSLCLTALAAFILFKTLSFLSKRISNKKEINLRDISFAKTCFDFLSVNKASAEQFFAKLLKAKKVSKNLFESENKFYYIDYSREEIKVEDICFVCSKDLSKPIEIFSNSITSKASELANKLSMKFICTEDVFCLMKDNNLFPTEKEKTAKRHYFDIKNVLIVTFDRKKAKHYMLYGVLLIAISFVVPFTFWYCFAGTIFVSFGLICLIVSNRKLS